MEYEPGVIENIVGESELKTKIREMRQTNVIYWFTADRVCWTDWLLLGYYASVFVLGCAAVLLGLVSCTPDNLRDIVQLRLVIQKPKA